MERDTRKPAVRIVHRPSWRWAGRVTFATFGDGRRQRFGAGSGGLSIQPRVRASPSAGSVAVCRCVTRTESRTLRFLTMTALVDDRFGPVMSLPYRTMGLG